MWIKARLLNLSSPVLFRKVVFISLIVENDRSAVDTVTGNMANNSNKKYKLGYNDRMSNKAFNQSITLDDLSVIEVFFHLFRHISNSAAKTLISFDGKSSL